MAILKMHAEKVQRSRAEDESFEAWCELLAFAKNAHLRELADSPRFERDDHVRESRLIHNFADKYKKLRESTKTPRRQTFSKKNVA